MSKPILFRTVLAVLLLIFLGLAVSQARQQTQLELNHSIQLKSKEAQLIELDNKYNDLLNDHSQTVEEKSKRIKELEKEKERLEHELSVKRNTPSDLQRTAQNTLNTLSGTKSSAQSLPKNGYKSFIYQKESGNNPGAINPSSGACGLGQALPCSKLPCSLSDYACQDRWFTNYAMERYGSWESAYNFWLGNSWW